MLDVTFQADSIRIGERLVASFHRTLRLPDDGRTYPLPPGFGRFPIVRPGSGPKAGTALVPMYRREALWIAFGAAEWKPNAVKVIVGGVNAVSGLPDDGRRLSADQDYLVCPDQLWLDGINVGDGVIRQFVAMPVGEGYGIEASLGGGVDLGGIEIVVFEPKPGRFPEAPPPAPAGPQRLQMPRFGASPPAAPAGPPEMTLGAGGSMRQKIYPNRHGIAAWDLANSGRARVEVIDSLRFAELTGRPPPATPIDVATYTAHGLPWFDLYDEAQGTTAPAPTERELKTVKNRDLERGALTDEAPVAEPKVTHIRRRRSAPNTRSPPNPGGRPDDPDDPPT